MDEVGQMPHVSGGATDWSVGNLSNVYFSNDVTSNAYTLTTANEM